MRQKDIDDVINVTVADFKKYRELFVEAMEKKAIVTIGNKEKIEDWSEYMHKTIMKAACRRLSEDTALSALVKEYVATDRVLLNFQNNKGE